MKISKFNYQKRYQSSYYIYNSLTDALFSFERPLNEKTLELFTREEINTMVANGLLVEDYDENLVTKLLLQQVLGNTEKSNLYNHIVIVPTLACNARCFYCYEEGIAYHTMSDKTLKKTIEFIKGHTSLDECLRISWFGGEPTLAIDILYKISSLLKAENYQIKASMITNGSKLTITNVKKLLECNVSHVQLSIDGFQDIYEQRKNYIDNTSFDEIINGIDNCINNGIFVTLRLNIDKNNLDSIYKLVDYLKERFKTTLLKAYPAPLFGTSVDGKIEQNTIDSELITDLMLYLNERNMLANKCNLKTGVLKYACMAHKQSSIVIDSEGFLYNCEHDVGRKNLSVGSIFDKTKNLDKNCDEIIPLKSKYSLCYKCSFLPKCLGGCDAVRRDGETPCGIIKQMIDFYIIQQHILSST